MTSVSRDSVSVEHMIAVNSSPLSPSPFVSINMEMNSSDLSDQEPVLVLTRPVLPVIVNESTDDNSTDEEPMRKRPYVTVEASPNTSTSGNANATNNTNGNISESSKLATRLEALLCCAVCLDLPKIAMYQCNQGHLMCAACFAHLLADGRLRDVTLTCPNCRVETNKSSVTRNRAVEKIAFELPSLCQYCKQEFAYKYLANHEKNDCPERITKCKYAPLGCTWNGALSIAFVHAASCVFPNKTGAELLPFMKRMQENNEVQQKSYIQFVDAFRLEKITFVDVKMKSMRLYSNNNKLSYESQTFPAFDQKWVIRARINNNQREPHQSESRTISYQLVLYSERPQPMSITFCALKGPFNNIDIKPQLYKHHFAEGCMESAYNALPLPDNTECNRLIAEEAFYLRLLMFSNYCG